MNTKQVSLKCGKFPFSQSQLDATRITIIEDEIRWSVPSNIKNEWPSGLIVSSVPGVGLLVSADEDDFLYYFNFLKNKRVNKFRYLAAFTDEVRLKRTRDGFVFQLTRGNLALKGLRGFNGHLNSYEPPLVKVIADRVYLFVPTKRAFEQLLERKSAGSGEEGAQ